MNISFKNIIKQIAMFVFGIGIIVSVTSASTWNSAPSNPPSDNAPAPINVSDVDQAKIGNFAANVIGANGFCLKNDCISAWPTSSGVSAKDIKIVETGVSQANKTTVASCDAGYKVLGGGFRRVSSTGDDGVRERAILNYPNTDSSWAVFYRDGTFIVYAVCLKVS